MANTFENNPMSKVPNSTAVLVLGILSLLGCCFYGLGFIPAIIGLVMAGKGSRAYTANPDGFVPSSYSQLKSGKIMCWIGLILSMLFILMLVGVFLMFGMEGIEQIMECNEITDPVEKNECMQEVIEELMGQ